MHGANLSFWTEGWDWSHERDEWSRWWGGTHAMWFGALVPRIHTFVPTSTILEIAPGYGRWTEYLRGLCERLILVDVDAKCIEACRKRFASSPHIEYHSTDSPSLDMVADGSVDFAYSVDSLVHVDERVLEAYIVQLASKLTADGIAFVHHSNAGATSRRSAPRRLRRNGALDVMSARSMSVTAEAVQQMCERAGLACVAQEMLGWESDDYLLDTISLFTRRGSRWDRPLATYVTRDFRGEASRMAALYARSSFPGPPFN